MAHPSGPELFGRYRQGESGLGVKWPVYPREASDFLRNEKWSTSCKQMTSALWRAISSSILNRRVFHSRASEGHLTKLSLPVPRAWERTFHWNTRIGSDLKKENAASTVNPIRNIQSVRDICTFQGILSRVVYLHGWVNCAYVWKILVWQAAMIPILADSWLEIDPGWHIDPWRTPHQCLQS